MTEWQPAIAGCEPEPHMSIQQQLHP
jgi:hypothetical protein